MMNTCLGCVDSMIDDYENGTNCRKCSNFEYYEESEEMAQFKKQLMEDALNEYATILMCVFSHSCEFYRTVDGSNIEAIEKQYIDDVILKCLEQLKEQKNE